MVGVNLSKVPLLLRTVPRDQLSGEPPAVNSSEVEKRVPPSLSTTSQVQTYPHSSFDNHGSDKCWSLTSNMSFSTPIEESPGGVKAKWWLESPFIFPFEFNQGLSLLPEFRV